VSGATRHGVGIASPGIVPNCRSGSAHRARTGQDAAARSAAGSSPQSLRRKQRCAVMAAGAVARVSRPPRLSDRLTMSLLFLRSFVSRLASVPASPPDAAARAGAARLHPVVAP